MPPDWTLCRSYRKIDMGRDKPSNDYLPGGRKLTLFFSAASVSSAVSNEVVLVRMRPEAETAIASAARSRMSRRQAARLFDLGVSTVINWVRRDRETGSSVANPMGGDRRSRLTGEHRAWLLDRVAAAPDLTLEELREELKQQRGISVGYGTVWRFFEREEITFKKNRTRLRARAA
jgi:transposase